jgi:hypothetical protein
MFHILTDWLKWSQNKCFIVDDRFLNIVMEDPMSRSLGTGQEFPWLPFSWIFVHKTYITVYRTGNNSTCNENTLAI